MKRVTTIVLFFLLLCACSNLNKTKIEGSKPLNYSTFPSSRPLDEKLAMQTHSPNNTESTTNDENNSTTHEIKSYPAPFIKLDGKIYFVTDTTDAEVDEEISEISKQITDERETADNYSNFFPKGAKVWSIKDTSPDEAIAIEYPKGTFTKCVLR